MSSCFNVTNIDPTLEKIITEHKFSITDGIGTLSNHQLLKIYIKLFEKESIENIKEIAKKVNEKL